MHLHYLQHVPFETPGNIIPWAMKNNHTLSSTKLYEDQNLPAMEVFDWLIIMGGPMNIYEEDRYPFLTKEKLLIEKAIKKEKIVMGICLGAQLIADVLGAKVYKGRYKEIGWYDLFLTDEANHSRVFSQLPTSFVGFHWHGDTFDIPKGGYRMVSSKGCLNQAFEYNNRVFALQFHLETSRQSAKSLIDHCAAEIIQDKYIMSADQMLLQNKYFEEIQQNLEIMLEAIIQQM